MPRIPFVPADLSEPADVVAAIRARRGGELLHIDRMLLNSPALASGWNGYLRAVRNDIGLDPMLRELAMCVVAVINGAEYEFVQHAPYFLKWRTCRSHSGQRRCATPPCSMQPRGPPWR